MIYFFYGDEEFNISNEIKKFRSKLDKDFIEMSYKYFNNPKFPDLVAAIKSQPMMFGKMLIEINCLSYLSGKTAEDKGFDDKQLAQITEALEGASENVDIIFVAQIPPDSQKKIDKRKMFFNQQFLKFFHSFYFFITNQIICKHKQILICNTDFFYHIFCNRFIPCVNLQFF